jgi:serine/threonine protein kinase
MRDERLQQVRDLFDAALGREPAARAAFLLSATDDETLRRDVQRLLDAHSAATAILPPSPVHRVLRSLTTTPHAGDRLGPYEILRELGRGGMGTVYLARRADGRFKKDVAVKTLRADMATPELTRRFERECEILATLDHPNITRLLDAGTTADGLPYFVMEFVSGRPITEYCDEAHLTTSERIRLCRQLFEAVNYAHSRGIVHRDLKPSNILVDVEGQVKVLDFGIARLTSGDAGQITESNLMLMTPQYASPEQVRGERATRASDVYALGVILYELLTGHTPYHLKSRIYHEIVRVVCEEDPTRPSLVIHTPVEQRPASSDATVTISPETAGRLRRVSLEEWKEQLEGDVESILFKALSKDPADRYASAALLGADFERHANGERVWARRTGWWHEAARAASRHRGAITAILGATIALLSGAVSLHWTAFLYAAAVGLVLLFWYAASDREFGRSIAESPLMSRGAIIVYAVAGYYALALPGIQLARRGAIPHFLEPAGPLVLALIAAFYLLAWIFRERWTGPLLVDFTESNYLWVAYAVPNAVGDGLRLWNLTRGGQNWASLGQIASNCMIVIALYLSGRREIRQAGIVTGGHILRWSRIRSWSWESADFALVRRSLKPILKLEVRRRLQFVPPVRLAVPAAQEEQITAILTRQLGEWPE